MAATHRLFVTALHEAGADPVESVGRPFDPNVHEGVATMQRNLRGPERSDKRGKHDALGANWKSGMDFSPPGGERSCTGTAEWQDVGDVSDFFASLFGRGTERTGRGGGVRVTIPGSDIEAELPVTLEKLLQSARRRMPLRAGGGARARGTTARWLTEATSAAYGIWTRWPWSDRRIRPGAGSRADSLFGRAEMVGMAVSPRG